MAFDFMTKIEGVPGKREVKAGMAYFGGTGPDGSTCGKCAFYGWKEMEKKCTKYRDMIHEWGPNIRKTQSACKYFEPRSAPVVGGSKDS